MKKFKFLFAISVSIFAMSCSTMHFHNGKEGKHSSNEISSWHHIGILELVEFSDSVQLKNRCDGSDWSKVTVEQEFVHGLVSVVAGIFYSPWEVTNSCRATR